MSDFEDDAPLNSGGLEEENEEVEEEEQQQPKKDRRRDYDDDEEDEEDDEEDEEEEDDPGVERGKKRQKHRHKRPAVNRFLDVEAEVDEDEEEEEEDEEYLKDNGFIDGEGDEDNDTHRTAVDNARLDRRQRELNDQDLAQIAADVSERYRRTAVRYTGDMNEIPQRLLMPSVHDANLWQIRVKPGKERDIVFSLMRKAIDLEFSNRPLQILSAFQRDSLPGMIYVEARSAKQVNDACKGLVGVYPSRGVNLVPIEEMASLLQIKKQDQTVTPGTWVRVRRGKYQGDLAQVMDITENGEEVGLKFIPRIDLNPRDDASVDGKKRKKPMTGQSSFAMRPPQRFFNFEEVVKVYGRKSVSKRNQVYVFQNDTYKDGFIEKDFRLTALQLDDVNPTLDEITQFTRGQDGTDDRTVDLSIIAEASRKAAIAVLQPGDHVEVFEGEQSGVHGTVHSIEQDVVTIEPIGVDFDGQRIQIPARSVRKRFKPGDHVKVMTGKNSDETGLVVSVLDNVVTFLSDMSMQEVSVFSKDLREAAEVGTGTNIVGNYELHDLVQLDLQTVGVIFKTERDSFRVLDQNGQIRLVQPHQISMRRDSNRAIATDSEGHELRAGDNVKEIDGEQRKGRVLHTHQSFFAFLHNRDYSENGGVFVTRARSLASLVPRGSIVKLAATDLSQMNPDLRGGANPGGVVGSGMTRGPRDRDIGVNVVVVKGPQKGYVGTIKDTNGMLARVELLTGNKVITIDKTKLYRKYEDGTKEPLVREAGMGPPRGGPGGGNNFPRAGTTNPYNGNGGGRTPWGATGAAGGRTPAPGGRTSAWGMTPNRFGDGGKTPAWSASSRTPNPYADGGKTPAWSASSRTPNPYTSGGSTGGWGGMTPARSTTNASWGGATPGRPASSNQTSAWGNTTPASTAWTSSWDTPAPDSSSSSWAAQEWISDSLSAPTPWGAPTPLTAPTPGPISAPTPGLYEGDTFAHAIPQTPGMSGDPYSAMDSEELSEKWLLDPRVAVKQGILAEIKNSFGRAGEGWHQGTYEGEKVMILSVLDSHNDIYQSSARIRFVSPHADLDMPVIPVQFLAPVEPEQVGQTVVILHGERLGEEAIVREVEAGIEKMTVQITGTHLILEVKRSLMAQITPVDGTK